MHSTGGLMMMQVNNGPSTPISNPKFPPSAPFVHPRRFADFRSMCMIIRVSASTIVIEYSDSKPQQSIDKASLLCAPHQRP